MKKECSLEWLEFLRWKKQRETETCPGCGKIGGLWGVMVDDRCIGNYCMKCCETENYPKLQLVVDNTSEVVSWK